MTRRDAELNGLFTVYSVDAADRLVLAEVKGNEAVFHQVMLALVQAPKPGRRQLSGELTPDEPCAFDAMEFVRSQVIGRQVEFHTLLYVDPLKRFSGQLLLKDGTDVGAKLLEAGLATLVKTAAHNELYDAYAKLHAAAKAAKRGLFAPTASRRVRHILPHPPAKAFNDAIQSQSLKCRVDRVLSGSGFVLHVANPADDMAIQTVQATLTGAQSPPTYLPDGTGSDPHGVAAKNHTERLLLHRNLTVRFDGVDDNGNYLITIAGPKRTFQEELLAAGLAKIVPATLQRAAEHEAMVQAENNAREAKLGLWAAAAATPSAPTSSPSSVAVVVSGASTADPTSSSTARPTALPSYTGAARFEGVVVQILSGDTLVVRNPTAREYTKVSFAGVRAPKLITRDGREGFAGGARPAESRVVYEGYTWEAREFLRTTCIGQRVRVQVEYARVMDGEAKELRPMVTITDVESGVNIGAALLRAGYAKFVLGRNDVCSCAEELRAAESLASEAQRGIHNAKVTPAVTRITEWNRVGEKQGRHFLTFLQRGMQGNQPPPLSAIVEQVMSGSSFRVYVPREHAVFTLKLAGVITPSNFGGSNDAFAEESKDFAVVTLQQREVTVMIETVDKGGNFIGYITVRGGKSFTVMLLQEGLATTSNAERCLNSVEMLRAEEAAKASKKNIWSDAGAIPAMAQKRAAQQSLRQQPAQVYTKAAAADPTPVYVTNVENAALLHVVEASADAQAALRSLEDLIATLPTLGDAQQKKHVPSKNEIVVARYSQDDPGWYRAKVVGVSTADKCADVLFLDYGNVQELPLKDIRAIPTDASFESLRSAPPFAKPVRLAYIKDVNESHRFADAVVATAWGYIGSTSDVVYSTVEYKGDGGKTHFCTITKAPAGDASLQQELLKAGLAVLDRRAIAVDPAAGARYQKHQEHARTNHIGLWIHGDVDDDDEDE